MKELTKLALQIEKGKESDVENKSRRIWLKNATMASASGLLLAACGQQGNLRSTGEETVGSNNPNVYAEDGNLLNAALGLEHEAIALYTAAAGLPFMQAPAVAPLLTIAGTFLSHHVSHRDSLTNQIRAMRVHNPNVPAPVESRSINDYVTPIAAKLTDVTAVLRLASLKEMGAAQAYLSLIKSFKDPELGQVSGMLGGDEAAHYGALRAALFAVLGDTTVTATTVVPASLPTGFTQFF